MAGTTLDRKLTSARASRAPFALATQTDDAHIRRLLRENRMPGKIALTLEREPDYFTDANVPGTEKQTIIACDRGLVVCMGNCAVRERFVNGQPRRVGYLGGLRLDAQATGRFDILRRGYDFFRKLQADKPADFYFTSIASDNAPARRFLERGLPGMPAYEFIGEFATVLIGTPISHTASLIHVSAGADAENSITMLDSFTQRDSQKAQFAPSWSTEELRSLESLGLRSRDFVELRGGSNPIASAALWDQRSFKQTVIRDYAPWLAMTRPAINWAARVFGTPRLPDIGSVLSHAFITNLVVAPDRTDVLLELTRRLRALAAERGIEFITLGLAVSDPRLAVLCRKFRCRTYRSRIYIVRWPGLGGAASELDGRSLGPEVALL